MRCDYNFCIYWDNKNCILDEISINSSGQCDDCIVVDFDEDVLKQKRQELLEKLD